MTDGKRVLVPPHRRRFGIVFQEYALLPHLNVFDNIALGITGVSGRDKKDTVNAFLDLFRIGDRASSAVATLSGGEQQRVALARTLAAGPDLVLLDEPFSNLDRMFRFDLYDELKAILKERETTTVLVTHDHRESFYFSDKVCVIRDGRILQEGTPADVYERPADAWIAAFVGDVNRLPCRSLRADFGLPCGDAPDGEVRLIRPERLSFRPVAEGDPGNGEALRRHFLGGHELLVVRLDSGVTIKLHDNRKREIRIGARVRVAAPSEADLLHRENGSARGNGPFPLASQRNKEDTP
jgi:iron(III) transport system ATP-binding protein